MLPFHAQGPVRYAPKSGGNYAYSDGHVDYLQWKDIKVINPAVDSRTITVYEDHWKWIPPR